VTQGSEALTAGGLGDQAFGFAFESGPAGGPGAIYVFRVRNAVFLFPGSGEATDRNALLTLARTVAQRARG
jgi:hypothetical protein